MTNLLDQLLALNGRTRADLSTSGLPAAMVGDAVADGPDVGRVRALPRREPATDELVELLSALLRKNPDVRLRGPQAEALRELYDCRGLFAPMRVGSGKTLVTLLAATLLGSTRPVLMIPAALRSKTRREFATYFRDWHVRLPTMVSYQELGRPDRENYLLELAPDLLILDEAHHARNLDAAVTRRIRRAIDALRPAVACLSGTLITEKLLDYHHHAVWSLGEQAPVPLRQADAERWAQAVDRETGLLKRIGAGALEQLPGGFHEHFRGSRGVVPTPGSDCTASINISTWTPDTPPKLRAVIDDVALTGERPDGELLDEWELPDCLCQLALGFYYHWDPAPPDWWLKPRRAWLAYVRAVLDEQLDGFDSPSQVVAGVENGTAPAAQEGRALLSIWRGVRDSFTPNPVPVWLDPSPLQQAVKRAGAGCLIWTRYRAAGAALEALGVPYFPGGTDPESARPGQTVALSISAHGTGRNLQAWSRNLVLTPPANADLWEQLIGRTHRAGQAADTVTVEVIESIPYHADVMRRVLTQARAVTKASGFEHKLVFADWL